MSRIKVRKYKVQLPEKSGKPVAAIRAVVIGDLHNKCYGEGNSALTEKILGYCPDVIFSVGDLTVVKPGKEVHTEIGLRLIKRLSLECPVYCIHGNHEYRTKIYPKTYPGIYEEIRRGLHIYSVHLLENRAETITIKGVDFTIYGYELPMKYYKKFTKQKLESSEIRKELGAPDPDTYNILLAHNPEYSPAYSEWGADLSLSGHFHGGMMRLPFIGGVISPQVRLFPKYDCGLYKFGENKAVVTAGLGTHSFAPRIFNPGEFSVIDFE